MRFQCFFLVSFLFQVHSKQKSLYFSYTVLKITNATIMLSCKKKYYGIVFFFLFFIFSIGKVTLKVFIFRFVNSQEDVNSSVPLSRRSQTRRRSKVTRMVFIVVLLFAVCWLPVHVFQLNRLFNPNFPKTKVVYVLKMISHTLSYANSIVNPFVYAFLNDGFRKAFRRTFPLISSFCPCAQLTFEGNSHASDMVDRCVQTRVGECQDENGNGGTEIVSMSHVSEHKNSIPLVLIPKPLHSDIEEKSGSELEN